MNHLFYSSNRFQSKDLWPHFHFQEEEDQQENNFAVEMNYPVNFNGRLLNPPHTCGITEIFNESLCFLWQ